MVVDNLEPHQQSISPIDSAPSEANGIESSDSITWCHRDYKPKLLVAIGNAFGLMGLLAVVVLPVAALFYGWSNGVFGTWRPVDLFRMVATCVFLNPAMWVICFDGLNSLAKPRSIRVTRRGLEVKLVFGFRREVPWQKVKVQFDRHANLKVNLDGRYKFVVKDDFERFEHLQDDLITFAAETDRSKWRPEKSEPVRLIRRYSPLCGVLSDAYINRPRIASEPRNTQPIELPPLSGT